MINKAFGRVIKRLRNEKKLSQEEFGDLVDLHRTYISQLERGLKSPSLNTIEKLCAILDSSLSALFAEVEKECVNEKKPKQK